MSRYRNYNTLRHFLVSLFNHFNIRLEQCILVSLLGLDLVRYFQESLEILRLTQILKVAAAPCPKHPEATLDNYNCLFNELLLLVQFLFLSLSYLSIRYNVDKVLLRSMLHHANVAKLSIQVFINLKSY